MSALLIYLVKVNMALVLFCAGYYMLLRPLTFYYINRVYLVAALVISSVYPLINLSPVLVNHQVQVRYIEPVVIDWQKLAPTVQVTETNLPFDYAQLMAVVFWTGVIVMAFRVALQFYALYRMHTRGRNMSISQFNVKVIENDITPFSFWQTIYINPDRHDPASLQSILQHEHVHVKQWHTLDILLSEVGTIFYWFNPGVWLIRKAIRENLEFITDQEILEQGADAKSYQYSLLQTSINTTPNSIVNHFNISTLKRRIIMMNSRRSSPLKLVRYMVALPLILVIILTFTLSKAEIVRQTIGMANQVKEKANAILTSPVALPAVAGEVKINQAVPVKVQLNTVLKIAPVDTTKKQALKIKSKTDSLVYIVDGVIQTNLSQINPADIGALYLFKGEKAREISNDPRAKNGVAIIKRKNSAASDAYIKSLVDKGIMSAKDTVSHNPGAGTSNSHAAITILGNTNGEKSDRIIIGSGKNTEVVGIGYEDTSKRHLVITEKADGEKPLIIVDGKVGRLKDVDPNDIESVTVLKDASATAIYGDAGKDGIILIATKKGSKKTKQ